MISDPKGLMQLKFMCPHCAGSRFGTSYATTDHAIGHCRTCDYQWQRKYDDLLNVFVKREES